MANQAVIALGSNLGKSEDTLHSAAKRLASTEGIELIALSSIYTSEPAIVLDQPRFKNAVMLVETELEPYELLSILQALEIEFGRKREGADVVSKGPRTLDLDIIDYEGVVSDDPRLTLPHPGALLRDFVVTPLLEISPHHVLANQKVVNTNQVTCGDIVDDNEDEASPDSPEEVAGCLFICATPIGNLGDITLRVMETLQSVDTVYCEDTRVTRKLLNYYDIATPLKRADAHKLPSLVPHLLEALEKGQRLAYVSDAGMPGISDPGALLVSEVRKAGYPVEVLPGASALTTALAAAGIKAHNHYFGGFFPRKKGAGTRLLLELAKLEDTALVFYESVHRTVKTLRLIAEVLPQHQVTLARELTKLYEELLSGTAAELLELLEARAADGRPLKGEVVLLIAPLAALAD